MKGSCFLSKIPIGDSGRWAPKIALLSSKPAPSPRNGTDQARKTKWGPTKPAAYRMTESPCLGDTNRFNQPKKIPAEIVTLSSPNFMAASFFKCPASRCSKSKRTQFYSPLSPALHLDHALWGPVQNAVACFWMWGDFKRRAWRRDAGKFSSSFSVSMRTRSCRELPGFLVIGRSDIALGLLRPICYLAPSFRCTLAVLCTVRESNRHFVLVWEVEH